MLTQKDRLEVNRLKLERAHWRAKFDVAFAEQDLKMAELYFAQCSLLAAEILTYFVED